MNKKKLEDLIASLTVLRNCDDQFSVGTGIVLLEIAARGQATAKELQQATGMTQSAINRALLRLSTRGGRSRHVGQPLSLVELREDPDEFRRHLAVLTKEGQAVVDLISK